MTFLQERCSCCKFYIFKIIQNVNSQVTATSKDSHTEIFKVINWHKSLTKSSKKTSQYLIGTFVLITTNIVLMLGKKYRCWNQGSYVIPKVKCTKCSVRLCVSTNFSCFKKFQISRVILWTKIQSRIDQLLIVICKYLVFVFQQYSKIHGHRSFFQPVFMLYEINEKLLQKIL